MLALGQLFYDNSQILIELTTSFGVNQAMVDYRAEAYTSLYCYTIIDIRNR